MDAFDRSLLAVLQEECALSLNEIAAKVGLSPTPCWNRIKRLEAEGVITGRVALIDPERLGLSLTAFVAIESNDHSAPWLERFAAAVHASPEVVDVYRLSGEVDYMLRVVVPDMPAYDRFYRRLIAAIPLKNVTSRFAMERIKATTALPLALAPVFAGPAKGGGKTVNKINREDHK